MTPEEAHDIMFDAIFGSCTPVADATEVLLRQVAKEREACAAIAESLSEEGKPDIAYEIAELIRQRT